MWQKSLEHYLSSETPLPKIIVIYGPTACGKTGLSLEVAQAVEKCGYTPHIISADSRQIYRGLDIGTGKITEAEMRGIPHHMIDIIDPSEKYSMVDFRR
jgi:tRNA dimethylallyltransferase